MIKLKKREKILALSIGGIILVFFLRQVFFSGLGQKIRNVQDEVGTEEVNLKSALKIRKQKDKIIKEYDNYRAFFELKKDSSERENIARLLNEIEVIARETGLSILNLNPAAAEAQQFKEYRIFKADLRAEATPAQLLNFLQKVQNNSLLIKLVKMSLVPKDEQATVLRLEATIGLTIL